MYSNKENVNILTALLAKHGVSHAVVCPGSRNAPIVHNLNACPDVACFPVTDERSAGFYALGMAEATCSPVAVCVTSGTALLNLLPAVAEAFYRKQPLIVVSADRPPQWIDQLDGQTLPQADALGRFVKRAVTLPEPHNDDERWYCNRLVNEALLATKRHGGGPVHINVPISEPLFEFETGELPDERSISLIEKDDVPAEMAFEEFVYDFEQAERPMVILGQSDDGSLLHETSNLNTVSACVPVLHEALSIGAMGMDEALYAIGDDRSYAPDLVVYLGGELVSKRVKQFIRNSEAEVWHVNADGAVNDVFKRLAGVIEMSSLERFLTEWVISCDYFDYEKRKQADALKFEEKQAFYEKWQALLHQIATKKTTFVPEYSQMAAVKLFEERICGAGAAVHYANSSAIRLANIYAAEPVCCNRGVNGIDGSLSTAAGFSVVSGNNTFCVIGDLSFFYDQNALWNQNLRGNFRILLLNNGGGGIFRQLRGLEQSQARDRYIAASHQTSAAGICQQNDVYYRSVNTLSELADGIEWLSFGDSDRPMLLEVFTDSSEDDRIYKEYYKTMKI